MPLSPTALEVPPLGQRKRVPMRVIRALVRHIAEQFDPEEILLFGSHAYGTPQPWSDVDLLVVKAIPEGQEAEAALAILRSLPPRSFSLDVLVRSPEVIERRKALGDWFLREITRKGKVMYRRRERRGDGPHRPSLRADAPPADSSAMPSLPRESPMNPLTEEWIGIAESDFDTAWLAMKTAEVPILRSVCFHAQQCAEKYLKAYLTEKQVEFPRRHPLVPLMELCQSADPEFETLKGDLVQLEGHAVATRYPGAVLTAEMAEAALAAAARVRAFVRGKLSLQ